MQFKWLAGYRSNYTQTSWCISTQTFSMSISHDKCHSSHLAMVNATPRDNCHHARCGVQDSWRCQGTHSTWPRDKARTNSRRDFHSSPCSAGLLFKQGNTKSMYIWVFFHGSWLQKKRAQGHMRKHWHCQGAQARTDAALWDFNHHHPFLCENDCTRTGFMTIVMCHFPQPVGLSSEGRITKPTMGCKCTVGELNNSAP